MINKTVCSMTQWCWIYLQAPIQKVDYECQPVFLEFLKISSLQFKLIYKIEFKTTVNVNLPHHNYTNFKSLFSCMHVFEKSILLKLF